MPKTNNLHIHEIFSSFELENKQIYNECECMTQFLLLSFLYCFCAKTSNLFIHEICLAFELENTKQTNKTQNECECMTLDLLLTFFYLDFVPKKTNLPFYLPSLL